MTRFFSLLIPLFLILCSCDSDNSRNSPSDVASTAVDAEAIFIKTLGLKDAARGKALFQKLNTLIDIEQNAANARREKVNTEHGDLLKLGEEKTGGRWKGEEAVKLVSALMSDHEFEGQIEKAVADRKLLLAEIVAFVMADGGLSRGVAAGKLKESLKQIWPQIPIQIPPAVRLEGLNSQLSEPVFDERYRSLMEPGAEFYYTDVYQELQKFTDGTLPVGAVPALFRLYRVGIPTSALREEGVEQPTEILRRAGPECCENVIACLVSPEKCGKHFTEPPYDLLEPLARCPEERRKEIFRAALESGWMIVENFLPGSNPWADQILDEYSNSPYGKPVRAPNRRPLSDDDQRLVQEKLQQFQEKFRSLNSGAASSGTNLYYKIKDDFTFERPNQKEKFDAQAFDWVLTTESTRK